MALNKEELEDIQDKAESIRTINITEFFTMLLEKATTWKERITK